MKPSLAVIIFCLFAVVAEASNAIISVVDRPDSRLVWVSVSRSAPISQISSVKWSDALKQQSEWYASDEAVRIADNVLLYQRANGGWAKNTDMAATLTPAEQADIAKDKPKTDTTIDNGTTYTQLRYLAKVITARNFDYHRAAFNQGLNFLYAAQYENGGFPQYFPLRKDYSRHITFNDDAMIGVLKLLRDIAKPKPDFKFIDEEKRAKAESALNKGIAAILKTQVVVNGKKIVWGAQHDEVTLLPAKARAYELPSLSGSESAEITEFLMDISKPSPQVVQAVESAVEWFRNSKVTGTRWIEKADERNPKKSDYRTIKDLNAPPLWARFYEVGTNRPIFVGRDGVVRYDVMEIEAERRNGYRWYVDKPQRLLDDYPAWRKKHLPTTN